MRKRNNISEDAMVNYVVLNNIETMKAIFNSSLQFIREIESDVKESDEATKEKVLLSCFVEAKRMRDLIKIAEREEKHIRKTEEYFDLDTATVVNAKPLKKVVA